MSYTSLGTTMSHTTTQDVYEWCSLYGTTVANCHATIIVGVDTLVYTTTSSFILSQQDKLGYAYVPMTAGPASASLALATCSVQRPQSLSSSAIASSRLSESARSASTSGSSTSTSTGKPNAGSGLSTGANAGIGVGVGLGVLALLALGGVFLARRRRRSKQPKSHAAPPPAEKKDFSPRDAGPGLYEFEQPAIKHEMPVGGEAQEMPGAWKGVESRYELPENARYY